MSYINIYNEKDGMDIKLFTCINIHMHSWVGNVKFHACIKVRVSRFLHVNVYYSILDFRGCIVFMILFYGL